MGNLLEGMIRRLRRHDGRRDPAPAQLTRLRHLGIWGPTAFGALLLALTLALHHVLPLALLALLILGVSAAGGAGFSWFVISQIQEREEEIAEGRIAQEALHQSREHFRRLVETTNVIAWEADLKSWQFTYVAPQAARILGYPLEAWFEDGFWVNHIHPEDRKEAVNFCLQASASLTDYEFEYRMVAADGREVWIRDIVTIITGEDGSQRLRGFMLDVTDRKQVENQLRESREQSRSLSAHLLRVQEAERARIAREVHDELGQALTALNLDLAWLAQRLPVAQKAAHNKIRTMTRLVEETTHSVRRLATELRPAVLDHLGLIPALEWLVKEFQERTGVTCSLRCTPAEIAIDHDRATAIFRICQEALTNIARHAEARRVTLRLMRSGNHLIVEVEDDGLGVPAVAVADPKSIGLIGMRERVLPWNGQVEIRGGSGQGTLVSVTLPLDEGSGGLSGDLP